MLDLTYFLLIVLLVIVTLILKDILEDLNDVYLKEKYRSTNLFAKLDYFRINPVFLNVSRYFKPNYKQKGYKALWLFYSLWMVWLILVIGLLNEFFK